MWQVGLVFIQYAELRRDRITRSSHSALARNEPPWGYVLLPYLEGGEASAVVSGTTGGNLNSMYWCPSDTRSNQSLWSYGKNVWFELNSAETGELRRMAKGPTYHTRKKIPNKSHTILVAELETNSAGDHIMAHFWYFGGEVEVAQRRHRVTSNYLWVDGHVSSENFVDTFDIQNQVDRWDPGRTAAIAR